jgi:acetyl-CoA carboxylase biotin carboxyl carrier protein
MAEVIKAEITGTVWKVLVKKGDEVEEDDEIMILESMKMEIPVESPVDGTVAEICVAEGVAITEGQILAKIDEG